MKRWIGASLALALGMTLTVPALALEEYPNDMALTNIGVNDDCARVTGVEIPIAVKDAMAMSLVEWTESAWTCVRPGTVFTVKNTGTDANQYGYVYLKYFEKQPQGSTVETYVDIVDEVTGEWLDETYKTVDLSGKYFAYSMDIRYCSLTKNSTDDSYGDQAIANATAGNGLYWKEFSVVEELPWDSEEILRLYPGDEVRFTLPDGGKKDCFYQLYVATCYPDEEDRSLTYYPTDNGTSYTYFNLMVDDFAYASTQNVLVDGKSVEFQCYALKDENGNDTNYIKLRDVASILNGTAAQFNVGWDGNVNMETGKAYVSNGSEMSTPYSGNRTYENATTATNVNGKAADLNAIVLKDDAGNGYTYYKLRDLGNALGFKVDWSAEKGIFIETN